MYCLKLYINNNIKVNYIINNTNNNKLIYKILNINIIDLYYIRIKNIY